MVSARERTANHLADGDLTIRELELANKYGLQQISDTLREWGKVRTSSAVIGANQDYIDIAGVGRYEWDTDDAEDRRRGKEALIQGLKDQFVFPIVESDDQFAESNQLRQNEKEAVQVGESPEQVVTDERMLDVASDYQQSLQTDGGGLSGTVLALLVGAVAVAVAVFGGN